MKKRIIVNYSSAFGLPGVRPDAGMALIHLLVSKQIELEAVVINGEGEEIPRITASLEWLLKFSDRTDVQVFNRYSSLFEVLKAGGEKAVLLDIGDASAFKTERAAMNLSGAFSEIVTWNPGSLPSQRRDADIPRGGLQDEELHTILTDSNCRLISFDTETAYQSPLDFDELVGIRSASKPLYYLLKDYLLQRASDGHTGQDFLYRLPPAVYLTNPELFAVSGNTCTHITDIKAYNNAVNSSWASWHKREAAE